MSHHESLYQRTSVTAERVQAFKGQQIDDAALKAMFPDGEPDVISDSRTLIDPSGDVALAVMHREHPLVQRLAALLTPERIAALHTLHGLRPECLSSSGRKQHNKFMWGFTPTVQGRYLSKGQSPTRYVNSHDAALEGFFRTWIRPLLEEMQAIFKQVNPTRWAAQNKIVPKEFSLCESGGVTAASLNWGNLVPLHIDGGDVPCGMSSLLIIHTGVEDDGEQIEGGDLLLTDVGERGLVIKTTRFTLIFFLAHESRHAVLPVELPAGAKRLSVVGYANKIVCARGKEFMHFIERNARFPNDFFTT